MRIHARTLLGIPIPKLWDVLTGSFTLVMDDGEIETHYKSVLFSAYVWEFHRQFQNGGLGIAPKQNPPLLLKHHVASVLGDQRLGSKTHLKLIGNTLWSLYDWASVGLTESEKEDLRFRLARLSYQITNQIYNDLSYRLEEYVTSLDIVDFINAKKHPRIAEAQAKLEPTQASIDNMYQAITDTLGKDETIFDNPISKIFRSGLASDKQLHQCLGPRGYITDIDSLLFNKPVLTGYLEGLGRFHDSLIESRSAAKSLMFSKGMLQDTEYFSRRLQLVSMAVENLHHTDCGTGRYLRWTVRGKEVDENGVTVYNGDLKHLAGKHYVDEQGRIQTVSESDKHLIGKKINLRSVICCQHPDPAGVCSVCFGTMSELIPPGSNLGHMCSTYMSQQSSQAVLSVKHLDGSSVVEAIILSDNEKLFMVVGPDNNSYHLARSLKNHKSVHLMIPGDRATNLIDVYEVKEIDRLAITRVTELKTIGLKINDGRAYSEEYMDVSLGKRFSSLTHGMLDYIKLKGWTVDDRGNYLIDLCDWDYSKSFATLPMRHFNMGDHSKDISKLLESRVDDTLTRDKFTYPNAMLVDLFTLVNAKLSVNLAVLEVTMYAAMVTSASNYDYGLPKPWTTEGVGVMRNTMSYRSLSATMAYQHQANMILSPHSYILTNRVDHVFDGVLMPREVVAAGLRKR